MKKSITLLFALSALGLHAEQTNVYFSGSDDPINPIMLSEAFKGKPTEIDGYLASYGRKDFNDTDYSPAYVGVDANTAYKVKQLVLSSSLGGPRANLDFAFYQDSSLTITSNEVLNFNGKADSAVSYNFHLAEGATNATLNLDGGIKLDLNCTSTTHKRNLTIGSGLKVYTKADVNITGATGSKFTVNGNWETTGSTTFTDLNTDIGGSYSSTGKTSIAGTSNVTISSGASFSTSTTANISNSSNVIIAEGATMSTGNLSVLDTANLTVNGTLNVKDLAIQKDPTTNTHATMSIGNNAVINASSIYARSGNTFVTLNGNAKINIEKNTNHGGSNGSSLFTAARELNVNDNAELTIKSTYTNQRMLKMYDATNIRGKLITEGGFIITSHIGLNIYSSDNVIKSNILLGEEDGISGGRGGKLAVYKSNDFSDATLMTATYTNKSTIISTLVLGNNVELKLNAISFFKSESDDTLEINFGSNSKLILNQLIDLDAMSDQGILGAEDKISIINFAEKSFGIKNHIASDDALLSQIFANGVDQFYWVKDNTAGVWWLSANAPVPEPAEWAMLFGALALGFAIIYRRRK